MVGKLVVAQMVTSAMAGDDDPGASTEPLWLCCCLLSGRGGGGSKRRCFGQAGSYEANDGRAYMVTSKAAEARWTMFRQRLQRTSLMCLGCDREDGWPGQPCCLEAFNRELRRSLCVEV